MEIVKKEIDEKQTEKLRSLKPGKYERQGEEVNRLIAGTHIKIMDHIRERYFKSREQLQKEKEEHEARERQEKEREDDRNEIMRFW